MFKRILVPLDGSELAERAIKPAVTLLEPDGVAVILHASSMTLAAEFNLIEQYGYSTASYLIEQSQQEDKSYLNAICEKYACPEISLKPHFVIGDPAGLIVDEASAMQANLIVMSSHGRSGVTRWLLGSVAERVLQAAPCPVLVIRQDRPIQRVLITLDGTNLSERALGPGLDLARKLNTEVTLLEVVEKAGGERSLVIEDLAGKLPENQESDADEYLKMIAKSHREPGKEIRTEIRVGLVAASILETADDLKIDLIVMATHGRTGLRRWTYGSVTQKVLHKSKHSMLIVRALHV